MEINSEIPRSTSNSLSTNSQRQAPSTVMVFNIKSLIQITLRFKYVNRYARRKIAYFFRLSMQVA